MRKKILVIDDSAFFRRIIKNELEGEFYEVVTAACGETGIDFLYNNDNINLVFLDYEMPKLNGLEVLREVIKRQLENPKFKLPTFVLTTAHLDNKTRTEFCSMGVKNFISKSFHHGELSKTIDQILRPYSIYEDETILVAENSITQRTVMIEFLKNKGFKIVEAKNGTEALEFSKKLGEKLSLIITDEDMPGLNGTELTTQVRQDYNLLQIPIIFISSSTSDEYINKFFNVGATDFLRKPYYKAELWARVKNHLDAYMVRKKLMKQTKEFEASNKMKDAVLGVISHDLRNPLTVINLSQEMIQKIVNDPSLDRHFESITSSLNFLTEMINELIEMSKMDSDNSKVNIKPLNVNTFFEDLLDDLRLTAKRKNIHVGLESKNESPLIIKVDHTYFIRIFNNLISNAIKFTNVDGQIDLRIEKSDSLAVIKIKDNGIGISSDKLLQIFDRFTSASRKGTSGEQTIGIGLSITKSLVEKLDGTISVESVENEGTEFTVSFPLDM